MEIRTILCPVDFTGQTRRELALARQLCQRFGAKLVLEHNLDPRPPNYLTVTWMWSEEFEGQEEQKAGKAQRKLKALLDELKASVSCEARLTRGPIDEVLLLLVEELSADLIVMGSHGWSTPEHKSLTEKMIGKSTVPVLTVGDTPDVASSLFADEAAAPGVRVLVTVDDDDRPQPAVEFASALAERTNAELLLLEVFPEGADSGRGADRLARAEEKLRALVGESMAERVSSKAVAGQQVAAILEQIEAGHVDLVVRPVHGGIAPWKKRDRQADFDLLHMSPCPVVYVPAKYRVE